jgi:hypothetical protein
MLAVSCQDPSVGVLQCNIARKRTDIRHDQFGSAYRIVQPYGRNRAREATLISEHATAADAFAEIDRLSARMVRGGAPSSAIELIVVDPEGRIVQRPEAH